MAVDQAAEAAAQPPSPSPSPLPWDCGSPLYDAFELASMHRVLDTHLMALPFAMRRPCECDDDVAVLAPVGAATGRTRSRRRRLRAAVGAAKAAARTGMAVQVLRSIICGRRL